MLRRLQTKSRGSYPSDVSDDEWALVAPYLTLLPEDSGQRVHALREVFNGLRYIVKTGAPWRWMPNNLPPWEIVYQQARRWLSAGCFEALAEHLRVVLRLAAGRAEQSTAAIIDSRTLRSTPESGAHAAYDGAKRKKGSKLHLAAHSDTFWPCTSPLPTPMIAPRSAGSPRPFRRRPGESVEIAFVDQGYIGEKPAAAAAQHGIALEVIKLPEAKRGFVLLPRRWVVERSFAWATCFRRLVKDYERCAQTLADLHLVAFACISSKNVAKLAAAGS